MKYLPEFPEISFKAHKISLLLKDFKSIFASQQQLNEYGPGVRQYFSFISHMSILYFILGLLAIYPIINNYLGNGLEGLEMAKDAKLYAIFTQGNLDKVSLEQIRKYASEQEQNEIMNRNQIALSEFSRIEESQNLQGYNIFYALVFLIGIYIQRFYSIKCEKTNISVNPTTSNYAIEVKGFPSSVTDPTKLRDFIVNTFGVNPREVNLVKTYKNTLEPLKDQVNSFFQILKIVLVQIRRNKRQEQGEFKKDCDEIKDKITEIVLKQSVINKANVQLIDDNTLPYHDRYPTKKGYIILESLNDKLRIERQYKDMHILESLKWGNHRIQMNFQVENPDNIFWKNLEYSIIKRFLLKFILIIGCSAISSCIIGLIRLKEEVNSINKIIPKNIMGYAFSIGTILANAGMNYGLEQLAKLPRYETVANQQCSLMKMKLFFNFVNSIFMPLFDFDLLSNGISRNWYVYTGKIVQQSVVIEIGLTLLNFDILYLATCIKALGDWFKNCIQGKRTYLAKTYKDHTPLTFSITEQYSQTLNVIYLTMAFSSGMPLMMPLGFIYLVFQYFSTNYKLIKFCKAPPVCDKSIHKLASVLAIGAFFLHCGAGIIAYSDTSIFPPQNVNATFKVTNDSSNSSYKDIQILYHQKFRQILSTAKYIYLLLIISTGIIIFFNVVSFFIDCFSKEDGTIDHSYTYKKFESILDDPKVKGNTSYNIAKIKKYKLLIKLMNSYVQIENAANIFQEFFINYSQNPSSTQFKQLNNILEEVKLPKADLLSLPKYDKNLQNGLYYYFQYFLIMIYEEFDISSKKIEPNNLGKKRQELIQEYNNISVDTRVQLNLERSRREELRRKYEESQKYERQFEFLVRTLEVITNQIDNGQPQQKHYQRVPNDKLKQKQEKLIKQKEEIEEQRKPYLNYQQEQKEKNRNRNLQIEKEIQKEKDNEQQRNKQQNKSSSKQKPSLEPKQLKQQQKPQTKQTIQQQQQQYRNFLNEFKQLEEQFLQQKRKIQKPLVQPIQTVAQRQHQNDQQQSQQIQLQAQMQQPQLSASRIQSLDQIQIHDIESLIKIRNQLIDSVLTLPQKLELIRPGLQQHLEVEETENLLEGIYDYIKSEIIKQIKAIQKLLEDILLILEQQLKDTKSNNQLEQNRTQVQESTKNKDKQGNSVRFNTQEFSETNLLIPQNRGKEQAPFIPPKEEEIVKINEVNEDEEAKNLQQKEEGEISEGHSVKNGDIKSENSDNSKQ